MAAKREVGRGGSMGGLAFGGGAGQACVARNLGGIRHKGSRANPKGEMNHARWHKPELEPCKEESEIKLKSEKIIHIGTMEVPIGFNSEISS